MISRDDFPWRALVRIIVPGAVTLAVVIGAACSSGPERSVEGFCTSYVEVAAQGAELDDPDDTAIPTLQDQLADIDRAASRAADQAPDEIADTVGAVIEPLHRLRSELDDAEERDQVTAALGRYRDATEDVASHQERLDEWTGAHCGVVSVTTTTAPVTVAPGLTG